MVKTMKRCIEKIWDAEEISEEWKTRIIKPIFKKVYKGKTENFREITLMNTRYKICAK